jgi:4-hydroxybenzoate polyprenyltransferase
MTAARARPIRLHVDVSGPSSHAPVLGRDDRLRLVREAASFAPGVRVFLDSSDATPDPDEILVLAQLCRTLDLPSAACIDDALIADTETADRLLGEGPDELVLSLHSHRPEVHDRIAGQAGAHERAVQTLACLASRREALDEPAVRLVARVTLCSDHLDEIEWSVLFALALGADAVSLQLPGPGITPGAEDSLSDGFPRDIAAFDAAIARLLELAQRQAPLLTGERELRWMQACVRDPALARQPRCGDRDRSLAVDARGRVWLGTVHAGRMDENLLGDVHTRGLGELWASERARELRAAVRACRARCTAPVCHAPRASTIIPGRVHTAAAALGRAYRAANKQLWRHVVRVLVRIRWTEVVVGKLSLGIVVMLLRIAAGGLGVSRFLPLLGLMALLGVSGYMLNDLGDRDLDARAGKRNAFTRMSARAAIAVGLSLHALLSLAAVYVCVSPAALVLVGVQMLASASYSIPPLRLKSSGAWGLGAVLLAQYLLPMSVILLESRAMPLDWLFCTLLIAVDGLCLELGHQRHDRERDVQAGLRTFATMRPPKALDRWYGAALLALGSGFAALALYVPLRLATVAGWMFALAAAIPVAWILVLMGLAIRRTVRWQPGSFPDPFYRPEGGVLNRLFTYLPNGFLPLYLGIVLLPAAAGVWYFAPLAIAWVRLSLPEQAWTRHVEDLGRLLWPPELGRRSGASSTCL